MAQKHGTIRHCVGGMRVYSACALQAQITDKLQGQSGLRGRSLPHLSTSQSFPEEFFELWRLQELDLSYKSLP